jgi:hypothetical protein
MTDAVLVTTEDAPAVILVDAAAALPVLVVHDATQQVVVSEHVPAVGMSGDQITIDGVVTGPHLSGADGVSPVIGMSGDQVMVNGVVTGPHLTGPAADPSIYKPFCVAMAVALG